MSIQEEKLITLNAPDLKTELVILHNEGFHNIIIDLTNTKFIDSSGISALLVGNRLCSNADGCFVLTNYSDPVLNLLKISKLDTVLNLIPTMPEARDFIMMEELQRELENSEDFEAERITDEDD